MYYYLLYIYIYSPLVAALLSTRTTTATNSDIIANADNNGVESEGVTNSTRGIINANTFSRKRTFTKYIHRHKGKHNNE